VTGCYRPREAWGIQAILERVRGGRAVVGLGWAALLVLDLKRITSIWAGLGWAGLGSVRRLPSSFSRFICGYYQIVDKKSRFSFGLVPKYDQFPLL